MARSKGNNRSARTPAEPQNGRTQRPHTIRDVAKLAKVSPATVSYVLNDAPDARVGEETRQRVLAAAAELAYVPSALARSLQAGRSNLVLMPFFVLSTSFSSSGIGFQQAIAMRLTEIGYTVLLQVIQEQPILATAQVWASLRPAGVIVGEESLTPEAVAVLHRAGVQAILAMGGTPSKLVPTALINFVSTGRLVGEHLASKGHRHIAVVVPRNPRTLILALQRLQGIEEAARRHAGMRIDRVDLGYDFAEAQRLVEQWRKGPRPTAVFTYNDEFGVLLMRALKDAGFRIPDEVALVGCDDLPICDLLRPRLTSIRTGPAGHSGRVLADFLDGMIQGTVPDQEVLRLPEPELIARDSS
jgi:DNA-binding LacI/PurR family transcriptional regulator